MTWSPGSLETARTLSTPAACSRQIHFPDGQAMVRRPLDNLEAVTFKIQFKKELEWACCVNPNMHRNIPMYRDMQVQDVMQLNRFHAALWQRGAWWFNSPVGKNETPRHVHLQAHTPHQQRCIVCLVTRWSHQPTAPVTSLRRVDGSFIPTRTVGLKKPKWNELTKESPDASCTGKQGCSWASTVSSTASDTQN